MSATSLFCVRLLVRMGFGCCSSVGGRAFIASQSAKSYFSDYFKWDASAAIFDVMKRRSFQVFRGQLAGVQLTALIDSLHWWTRQWINYQPVDDTCFANHLLSTLGGQFGGNWKEKSGPFGYRATWRPWIRHVTSTDLLNNRTLHIRPVRLHNGNGCTGRQCRSVSQMPIIVCQT